MQYEQYRHWSLICFVVYVLGESMSKYNYILLATVLISQSYTSAAHAQVLDASQVEAKKLLERISSVKVPIDNPLVTQMAARVRMGDRKGAAELATTHPEFLNTTVKQMALKMSTREETMRLNLNDFAAAFIGVTRDNRDARELLTGNFYYMGDATKIPAGVTVRSALKEDILDSNNHYDDLGKREIDIGAVLMRVNGQSVLDGQKNVFPNPEPAGVITLRAFMNAHAVAGTNRRPIEYTFREFMCVPMDQMADTSVTDVRIARDIDRFPGGDHLKFLTTCKGCHTQMDSFRGAFAHWDVNGNSPTNSLVGSVSGNFDGTTKVSRKLNANGNVFPGGYQYRDNTFFNNSRAPANANLFGWRGDVASVQTGTTAFATQIANSTRFSQCMVKRIYDSVCRANVNTKTHLDMLKQLAGEFEANGYNIKKMYESIAISSNCQAQ